MKRKIPLMLVAILLLQIILPMVSIIFESGITLISNAEDNAEYYINTAQDLWDFASEVNNGNTFEGVIVNLTANIDLGCSEDNQWIPIGVTETFKGIFDGKNHKIKGLYIGDIIGTEYYNIGLFGKNEGIIKNLIIEDSSINISNVEEYSKIGGIVAENKGNLINCNNTTNININLAEDLTIYLGGIVRL